MNVSYNFTDFVSLTSNYVDIGNLHKTILASISSIDYISKKDDVYTIYFLSTIDINILDAVIQAYDGSYEVEQESQEQKEEAGDYTTINVSAENFRGDDGTAAEPTFAFNANINTGMYLNNDNLTFSSSGGDILQLTNKLSTLVANYEANVVDDNDIPNKKYVDDAVSGGGNVADATLTFTNKTIESKTNSVAANKLHTNTSTLTIDSTDPAVGQVLVATSATEAKWQNVSSTGINGPGVSLDKEMVIFDGTNGSLIKGTGIRHHGALAADPSGLVSAGDRYYNTTINHEMCYDASRAKWLSMTSFMEGCGVNGNVRGNRFYKRFNGMDTSSTLGTVVQKGTIVFMGYNSANAVSHTMQVLVDGSVVYELASGGASTQSSDVANADFPAGVLSFRNRPGSSTTTRLQATIYYKLRA